MDQAASSVGMIRFHKTFRKRSQRGHLTEEHMKQVLSPHFYGKGGYRSP